MGLDDDIAFFERVPLFAALDETGVADSRDRRRDQADAERREVLFYAGELADGGYIVQDGSIRLEPGTFSDGKEVIVGPGTLIGELALLTDMVCRPPPSPRSR